MIKKVLKTLKKEGIIATIKKILRYVKYKVASTKKKNILEEYIDLTKYDTVILFENNFGWQKIMKQRPQQIAEGLPDTTLMLYHSHEDSDYNAKERVAKIKDNLLIIDFGYFRNDILNSLATHNNKYLMIYSTDYIPYERILMYEEYGYEIIYEYVDDINEELSGKEMYEILTERHNQLKNNQPYVIATATKLYEKVQKEGFKYTNLISNGVDYKHFETKEYEVPEDMISIKNKHKILIGYYGALATWVDYKLIIKMAENKDYGIVLLGQDYDNTLEKSGVLDCENVYYLGRKQYNELPVYGCNLDILTIPFKINDITKSTSPVKIFEYMAMEKPIVTTALPECKKYKSVMTSNTHQEFLNNIEKAIKKINDKKYKLLLSSEAKNNTWESKAYGIVDFINSTKYNKIKENINEILTKEKYDRIVVWRSPFGWNVPLFQRPQHIAKQLSEKNCLVFYEVTPNTDNVRTIKYQADNLYLINLQNYYLKCILKEVLCNASCSKYLQIYSTNWSMSVEEVEEYKSDGFKILYEYIDDISPELAGTDEIPPYILDKYNYAIDNKDVLIVTTANELYEDINKKRGRDNLVLSCNGVDYNFFKDIDSNFKYEKDFLNIINNGKINLCYYGALASWFDYDLINIINNENKYNIILFGIKYDNSYDKSNIKKLQNVYFLGSKEYKILKYYANKMDILMIPFLINSITQATSPLKLFEYMALQKPIVTTAMKECKKYKSVLTADTHEEFIELLEKCEKLKKDKKYLELLDKEAKENDWSKKTDIILDLIRKNEKNSMRSKNND